MSQANEVRIQRMLSADGRNRSLLQRHHHPHHLLAVQDQDWIVGALGPKSHGCFQRRFAQQVDVLVTQMNGARRHVVAAGSGSVQIGQTELVVRF